MNNLQATYHQLGLFTAYKLAYTSIFHVSLLYILYYTELVVALSLSCSTNLRASESLGLELRALWGGCYYSLDWTTGILDYEY